MKIIKITTLEAVQWNGEVSELFKVFPKINVGVNGETISIEDIVYQKGDWIIEGVSGEFFRYNNENFKETFLVKPL